MGGKRRNGFVERHLTKIVAGTYPFRGDRLPRKTWASSKPGPGPKPKKSEISVGLKQLGFERGDKLAIIGDNRQPLLGDHGGSILGRIPVPLYQDSVAQEMKYVLDNADIRFAVVENQEQTDKLLEIREDCPKLETSFTKNTRGMNAYPGVPVVLLMFSRR